MSFTNNLNKSRQHDNIYSVFEKQGSISEIGGPLLTLILLFMTTPTFANNVDPDQTASEEAI